MGEKKGAISILTACKHHPHSTEIYYTLAVYYIKKCISDVIGIYWYTRKLCPGKRSCRRVWDCEGQGGRVWEGEQAEWGGGEDRADGKRRKGLVFIFWIICKMQSFSRFMRTHQSSCWKNSKRRNGTTHSDLFFFQIWADTSKQLLDKYKNKKWYQLWPVTDICCCCAITVKL